MRSGRVVCELTALAPTPAIAATLCKRQKQSVKIEPYDRKRRQTACIVTSYPAGGRSAAHRAIAAVGDQRGGRVLGVLVGAGGLSGHADQRSNLIAHRHHTKLQLHAALLSVHCGPATEHAFNEVFIMPHGRGPNWKVCFWRPKSASRVRSRDGTHLTGGNDCRKSLYRLYCSYM